MTIVVTGAAGFIGSALMAWLTREGQDARGITRRRGHPGLIAVTDYRDVDGSSDDVLIHLAEPSGISGARERGSAHVAEVAGLCRDLLDRPWAHVVYASSGVVYGDAVALPRRPDEPVTPRGEYASGKRACENLVLSAGGTVLRLANIYGFGMTPGTVISDILQQIGQSGPVLVRDAAPVRDFLHVRDAVAGLAAAARHRPGGVLNLGSGEGVSIGTLARTLLDLAGETERMVRASVMAERSSHLVLDPMETTTRLDWCPHIPLAKGLEMVLRHTA
ncbi:NAD(P)-dependent oxidoreductase [Azospirillum sp.]|uniref:NAD-dependent epimerase/dehydratase family protein n=1 Tax=Azospirillum sp. TaxID=34012 RepID=UPI002606BB7B|nr:NAD(P)-dependent oxidoreductase [Azospirillum sp.]